MDGASRKLYPPSRNFRVESVNSDYGGQPVADQAFYHRRIALKEFQRRGLYGVEDVSQNFKKLVAEGGRIGTGAECTKHDGSGNRVLVLAEKLTHPIAPTGGRPLILYPRFLGQF